MISNDMILVISPWPEASPAKLTQHKGMLGQPMHQLVVIQVAQPLELLATDLALEWRLHMTFHMSTQAVLVHELLVANRTVQHRIHVGCFMLLQLGFGVEAEWAPFALVLAVQQTADQIVFLYSSPAFVNLGWLVALWLMQLLLLLLWRLLLVWNLCRTLK